MENFTPISRRPAKCAMRTAWAHSGALRAQLHIQGNVMAHFASRREIGVKFPMRAASVDPKNTQLTPLTKPKITKKDFLSPTSNRLDSTSFVKTNAPGGLPSSGTAVLTDFLKNHVFEKRACVCESCGLRANVQCFFFSQGWHACPAVTSTAASLRTE